MKQQKNRAHAEQTHGRAIHLATECLAANTIFALDKACVDKGLRMFLRCLIRRLDPGAAGNLIAQLPSTFHEELLSAPAGPDTSIDL